MKKLTAMYSVALALALSASASDQPVSRAINSVSDVAGIYDISCDWLLNAGSGAISVQIIVMDESVGEVAITGWPQDFVITGYVDTESATLSVSNRQYVGNDGLGDEVFFYFKGVDDDGRVVPGALDITESVGTITDKTISFPSHVLWTIGTPEDEDKGYWYLAGNMKFNKYIEPEDPNDGWTSVGEALFQDGWLLPVFGIDQTRRINWYKVELQQSDENANIYRLVNPYKGNSPLAYSNQCKRNGYIQFDVTDPDHVTFAVVPAGFTFAQLGVSQIYCYNRLTLHMLENNSTAEDIIDIEGDNIPYTTFRDGIVTLSCDGNLTDACFGKSDNIHGGYSWIDQDGIAANMETKIFFPGCEPGASEINNGWTTVGNAVLQDGWVLPLYSKNQFEAENIYEVPLQQNNENPYRFRLVDPYHGMSPVAKYNSCNDIGFIQFDISDPDHVVFDYVTAGMGVSILGISDFYCYNRLSLTMASLGLKAKDIIGNPEFEDMTYTTYKDGVVVVPAYDDPVWVFRNDGCLGSVEDPNAGYNWGITDDDYVNMETRITLPDSVVTSICPIRIGNPVEEAPVEYYNLQGIRVAEPLPGHVTIRRQGASVTKIITR